MFHAQVHVPYVGLPAHRQLYEAEGGYTEDEMDYFADLTSMTRRSGGSVRCCVATALQRTRSSPSRAEITAQNTSPLRSHSRSRCAGWNSTHGRA